MLHTSFWSMRDSAFEVYKSMEVMLDEFGWDVFSKEGEIRCEAYEILVGAFKRTDNKAELATVVAGEIYDLWKDIQQACKSATIGYTEEAEEAARMSAVAKYLIRYIKHNCEEKYWEDHVEYGKYNYEHDEWGW